MTLSPCCSHGTALAGPRDFNLLEDKATSLGFPQREEKTLVFGNKVRGFQAGFKTHSTPSSRAPTPAPAEELQRDRQGRGRGCHHAGALPLALSGRSSSGRTASQSDSLTAPPQMSLHKNSGSWMVHKLE